MQLTLLFALQHFHQHQTLYYRSILHLLHLFLLEDSLLTKFDVEETLVKHKARLVAKDFSQQTEIDYNETFALAARLDIVRIVLAITGHHKWKVYKIDVKIAFLNGILQEEVYVQHPRLSVNRS